MQFIKNVFNFIFVRKELRDYQAHARFWKRMYFYFLYRFVRYTVIASLLVASHFGFGYAGATLFPNHVYAERQVMNDSLSLKIKELKQGVINDLKSCESGGYKEADGLITYDPDKSGKQSRIPSFGSYQFKQATVMHYYKAIYGTEISGKDAITLALDDSRAQELALSIGEKYGFGKDWVNCTRKHNLDARMTFIQEQLEK